MSLRAAVPSDHEAIAILVTAAFGSPDEARIVTNIRAEGVALAEIVATAGDELIGHILFSRMTVAPARLIAGQGPVAVSGAHQRSGVGSALCCAGVEEMRGLGCEAIVVLGHPSYYPRFGFSARAAEAIDSPYSGLPAFMALELKPGGLAGRLEARYPAAFG